MARTQSHPQDTHLTVSEVAIRLGVERKIVFNFIHDGDLSAVDMRRAGGKRASYRIALNDLEDFRLSRLVKPKSKTSPRRRHRKPATVKRWV